LKRGDKGVVIYTIGFSKKNLKTFIDKIKDAGVTKLIDIRLHNTSQLAGYAKKDDLEYILSLVGIAYEHHPELAPTDDILKNYKKKKITWNEYERQFKELLSSRNPSKENILPHRQDVVCLLCAESKPERCHRRLVAEHFKNANGDLEIVHL
jgi:uncharacterized protein (DUF488 family)